MHLLGLGHCFATTLAADVERKADVLRDGEGGEQMIGLEHEADMLTPESSPALRDARTVDGGTANSDSPIAWARACSQGSTGVWSCRCRKAPSGLSNMPPLSARLTFFSACTRAGPLPRTLLTLTASMMELVIASAQPQGRRE